MASNETWSDLFIAPFIDSFLGVVLNTVKKMNKRWNRANKTRSNGIQLNLQLDLCIGYRQVFYCESVFYSAINFYADLHNFSLELALL